MSLAILLRLPSVRLVVSVVLLAACVACGQSPLAEKKPSSAPAEPAAEAAGPLWEEPQLSAMMKAYREALPGKRMVLSFSMNVGGGRIQVQDPAKPENVDQYNYRDGKVGAPIPVRLHLFGGKLEDGLFDLDTVAIEKIPELARTAMERIPLEGGHVIGARVERDTMGFSDGKVRIKVDVEGTRKSGTLEADAEGNVLVADEDG